MNGRTAEDWRHHVYRANRLGGRVQVLLLLLADNMNAERKVSIPRARLAAEMNVSERRVAQCINAAIECGFLTKIGGGYRGRTTEYQALFPGEKGGRLLAPIKGEPSFTLPERKRVKDGGDPSTTTNLSVDGADRDVQDNPDHETTSVSSMLSSTQTPWLPQHRRPAPARNLRPANGDHKGACINDDTNLYGDEVRP